MCEWKQERPEWCAEMDCEFVFRVQDAACAGRLSEPEEHDGDMNTHRVCMRDQVDDSMIATILWNHTDAWLFGRLCHAIHSDLPTSIPVEVEPCER